MLVFNHKDMLQRQWLAAHFGSGLEPPAHGFPAAQAFVDACLAGIGWGMCPVALVASALERGQLVPLKPDATLAVTLSWQHARVALPALQRLTLAVRQAAQTHLEPA
jgi:LysR family transcriptional regulator (chromosome initiation inhibitor)